MSLITICLWVSGVLSDTKNLYVNLAIRECGDGKERCSYDKKFSYHPSDST